MGTEAFEALERLIAQWRTGAAADSHDPAGLGQIERDLRAQAAELLGAGLDAEEAFLVALKRVSDAEPALRPSARQYTDRLLTPAPASGRQLRTGERREFAVMLACAVAAAAAIKVPALLGHALDGPDADVYLRNLSLFALPFLAVFLAWKHRPPVRQLAAVAAAFAAGIVLANAYPFAKGGSTQMLAAIHLPVVLWLTTGVASAGGEWWSLSKRMEYTRFTGEWFVTYTLIALGGGVLAGLTTGVFQAIGVNAGPFVSDWLLPCGAMGAVVVSAWLVETRHTLVGGIAPMLARVFTPLFAVMLVALLVGVVWSRGFIDVEREVLILLDLLLVLVLAMLLYGISARDPKTPPDAGDRVQLLLVGGAFAVDLFALANIAARLSEFGWSANRTAALGLNLVLLAALARSAYLQAGFLRSVRGFTEIERWHMRYLPVYAIWASVVVTVFPPVFGFR